MSGNGFYDTNARSAMHSQPSKGRHKCRLGTRCRRDFSDRVQPGFQRNGERGFTLIEIMVVVVIIGILGALIVPSILGRADDARVTAAHTDLRAISNALDLYRLDNFTYPSTDQGLEALVTRPSGAPEAVNWNPEGYLQKLPTDPWKREYLYISPGTHGPFDLYSLGADGREGGEGPAADISSWDLE